MEPINELAAALAKAQADMKNPGFDSTNPHFRNKFASLASGRNAVIPTLAKYGLSGIQNLTTQDAMIACETILMHASGQSMRLGPLMLPATKTDAQGFGSAATYARRYSLMAVCGVVGDEDDDANAATGKPAAAEHQARVNERTKATKNANEYAQRVIASLNDGADLSAVDIMREAKDVSEEFATDVWHCFSTPIRNRLRELSKSAA